MTLLIVDDQSRVVKGIMTGVDWRAEGFDEVYPAYNAAEARRVLGEHTVDVMLCDIEMPVENGLSLVEWMRGQGMATRCIFLTSHMSFDYAQKALRLGSVDYLVLPAPYPDIQKAVQKAVEDIKADTLREKLTQYGQLLQDREEAFIETLLHSYMLSGDAAALADAQRLEQLPGGDTPCYLALVQVLRQEGGIEAWDPKSLRYAISNIVAELFSGYGQKCYWVGGDNARMFYLVYGEEYHMDFEGVVRQLEFLIKTGTQYLSCLLACYTDAQTRLDALPGLYSTLMARSEDNVALQSGVFYESESGEEDLSQTLSQTVYSRLHQALADGYTQAVLDHSLRFVDELVENGQLNAKNLETLYKWMIQLFSQAAAGHGLSLQQLYPTGEAFAVYREGSRSVEHLKQMIRFTLERFDELIQHEAEGSYSIEQIIAYIHDHMEEDIRRTDLASHFHLNPDYLARVFKKETGKTLKEFITGEKITLAQDLLRTTSLPVGMIAAKVGYSSFSHFSKVYLKARGISPSEERTNARNSK